MYFRCGFESTGSGYEIDVTTTSEEFYNQTITVTKNSQVVATGLFDSTGHATIIVKESGTYTLSVTYEGVTASQEITISVSNVSLEYGLQLNKWITAGSTEDYPLDPEDYPTFADLEADEEAIRQLMLVHNAVDYLATAGADDALIEDVINSDICAKWINLSDYALDILSANTNIKSVMDTADKYGYGEWGLIGQVPVMTSNTAPSGTVTATNYYQSGREAYKAFNGTLANGSINNLWQSSDNTPQAYIQYKFSSATKIDEFYIHSDCQAWSSTITSDGSFSFKLQASNGSGFIDLTDVIELTANNYVCSYKGSIPKTNRGAYTTYRVQFVTPNLKYSASTSGSCLLDYVQFYQLGAKGNVPIMTANNAPYGTAIRSSALRDNMEAWTAFDGNDATTWLPTMGNSHDWIGYTFVNPMCLKKVYIKWQSGQNITVSFIVQGSNDGFVSDIHDIQTIPYDQSVSAKDVEILNNNDFYMSYRLYSTSSIYPSAGIGMNINALQFYGRELKPLVPTMTSNTTPKGTASATGATVSNRNPWNAFDGVWSTFWISTTQGANVTYTFDKEQYISCINVQTNAGASGYNATGKIQYQKNNVWIDVDTITINNDGINVTLPVNDTATAIRYLNVTLANTSSGAIRILQAYGPDYSEKEFASGSTRKTIYDHGVELETIESKTIGSGTVATKEANQLYISVPTTANTLSVIGGKAEFGGYDYLYAKAGNKFGKYANFGYYTNLPTSVVDAEGFMRYSDENGKVNNLTPSLDISSVSGEKYAVIYGGHGGAATYIQAGSIKELWLE